MSEVLVFNLSETKAETLEGGAKIKWIINKQNTGSELTVAFGVAPPGAGHHWHDHPTQDEVIFIIKGEGTLYTPERNIQYSDGTVIFVPRGVKHQNINTGDKEAHIVAIFNPPVV